jgi:hypothetical protein
MTVPEARHVLLAQGTYYVASGVSPFVSPRLFERVTGPKRDWWLVQTVGGLVTVIGCALVHAGGQDRRTPETIGLAAGSATVLSAIEVVHVARGRISPVYLADAVVQAATIGVLAVSLKRPAIR